MLKKVTIVLSVVAAFGFALAAPTFAAPNNKNKSVTVQKNVNRSVNVNRNVRVNRNVNVNRNVRINRNVNRSVNRSVTRNFVVGRSYNGHRWFGHNRHRWHGRWYAYGEGECWIRIDGEWFWNELVCPL
jgi:hypothetical protein